MRVKNRWSAEKDPIGSRLRYFAYFNPGHVLTSYALCHGIIYKMSGRVFDRSTINPSEEPRASARGFFKEKAILNFILSVLKHMWPFLPALPSGASWLFHVN